MAQTLMTVYLDAQILERIDAEAKAQGVSRSALVREAIKRFLTAAA